MGIRDLIRLFDWSSTLILLRCRRRTSLPGLLLPKPCIYHLSVSDACPVFHFEEIGYLDGLSERSVLEEERKLVNIMDHSSVRCLSYVDPC